VYYRYEKKFMNLPDRNQQLSKVPFALLGLLGAIVVYMLTSKYGVGISPDSVTYISVARNVAKGVGYVGYDGYYFVLQPPLYPALLAAMNKLFLLDPLISAGYLNALFLGLIIYVSGLLLLRHVRYYVLAIVGTIAILVSLLPMQIFLIALSEPLFIVLILLYFYYFDIYRTDGTIASFLLFSTAAALACLTRYVGVVLVAAGIISIFTWGGGGVRKRLMHIVYFQLIAIIPTGIWVIRNHLVSGTLTGPRANSSYTLSSNILFAYNTMLNWYSSVKANEWQLFLMTLVLLIAVLAALAIMRRRNVLAFEVSQVGPVVVFIILYSAIIIISSTTTAYDKIGNRLLSPVFIPSMIIIFFLVDYFVKWASYFVHYIVLTIVLLVGMTMWIKYQATRTRYYIEDYIKNTGVEYNSSAWINNSVIKYLEENKQLKSNYTFYSNAPDAVYILADVDAKWSSPKRFYNSPVLLDKYSNNSLSHEKNDICFVWFYNVNRNFLFTPDEIKKTTTMISLAQLKDGEIYIIPKKQ
jgi:hypothetical protein